MGMAVHWRGGEGGGSGGGVLSQCGCGNGSTLEEEEDVMVVIGYDGSIHPCWCCQPSFVSVIPHLSMPTLIHAPAAPHLCCTHPCSGPFGYATCTVTISNLIHILCAYLACFPLVLWVTNKIGLIQSHPMSHAKVLHCVTYGLMLEIDKFRAKFRKLRTIIL